MMFGILDDFFGTKRRSKLLRTWSSRYGLLFLYFKAFWPSELDTLAALEILFQF